MKAPKILIVDDERSVRQAICFELEDAGYEVINASSYQEAMDLYHMSGADLVITDLFLESGNGIDLLEKIKKEKEEIPYIIITAFPDSELGEHAKLMCKDRFYSKPFFMGSLTNQINEIFKSQAVQFA
ncbi:MAG: response regulator [Calditrichaceae bacterium]